MRPGAHHARTKTVYLQTAELYTVRCNYIDREHRSLIRPSFNYRAMGSIPYRPTSHKRTLSPAPGTLPAIFRVLKPTVRIPTTTVRVLSLWIGILSPAVGVLKTGTEFYNPKFRVLKPTVRVLTPTVGVLKRGVAFYDPKVRVLNPTVGAPTKTVRVPIPTVRIPNIAPSSPRPAFQTPKHGFPAEQPVLSYSIFNEHRHCPTQLLVLSWKFKRRFNTFGIFFKIILPRRNLTF